MQPLQRVVVRGQTNHADQHMTAFSEFYRVTDEIGQNLPNATGVADVDSWQEQIEIDDQVQFAILYGGLKQ